MTPAPSPEAQESRQKRNTLSPVDQDGLPMVEAPPAKVRVQIPDIAAAPQNIDAKYVVEEMKKMHEHFKQAIVHVVGFVDANTMAISQAKKDICILKQSATESPTMVEFDELSRAIPAVTTQAMKVQTEVETASAQLEALSARMEGLAAETKNALELLDAANTARIAETTFIKEVDERFQLHVTRDGNGLVAVTKDLDTRVKLL